MYNKRHPLAHRNWGAISADSVVSNDPILDTPGRVQKAIFVNEPEHIVFE